MSKKKGKPAARKAPKKKAAPKKAAKKSVSSSRTSARLAGAGAAASGRTLHVTIFLYRTGNGNKIRTSPQRLYATPGDSVEWTVVNLIDGSDVPVTLTWPEIGPWGKDPIQIRNWERKAFGEAPSGRFKFVVSALDAQEDPEIDIPDI
jgi:plastocyanin